MRTAFVGARPPGRIASSTSATGASRTSAQLEKRSRRRAYATSRLRSFVFCESTVRISSSTGARCGRRIGCPYVSRRRSTMARTRRREGRFQSDFEAVAADTRDTLGAKRRRVPDAVELSGEVAGVPVAWREVESRTGAPVLYVHGVPTEGGVWLPFLERTGG